ncbi:CRISPR-associated helicase Cas3' [Haloferula chungangensis]|uniref:CRISPR-associated helicase Cas3 n=1 Tax=Haloferula chungangensis TaxID=1048331 RepID=A0ABW2L7L5_9BACT
MPDLPPITLEDCWAKTDPMTGEPALTVRDHCLAAGAVAEALLIHLPREIRRFLPHSAPLLCALHDIGKLTVGFQAKCPRWLPQISPDILSSVACDSVTSHGLVSEADLRQRLSSQAGLWAAAIGSHHGRYQNLDRAPFEKHKELFAPLRDELFKFLSETFPADLPADSPINFRKPTLPHHVFLLGGLVVFADWIASNDRFFPLHTIFDPVSARRLAADAIRTLRIDSGPLRERPFQELFATDKSPNGFSPNSLQLDCLNRITHPGLYLIEAPMGMGKTEAALTAAHRLICSGHARGIYFALPTQLTSNAIHRRLAPFLANVLETPAPLALAHSSSWLADPDSRLVRPLNNLPKSNNSADEAARWFTSRRALLADYGVGTIDQALLAVLPVKFHQLRCYGLAGKVVIFDEVHSYDAYTGSLLEVLIDHLLNTGSTVLVLSATLAAPQRARLLAVGHKNNLPTESIRVLSPKPKAIEISPATGQGADKHLLDRAVNAAQNGACVLWIRNTVDLAQATFKAVAEARQGDSFEIGLLHSRFTLRERHGDPTNAEESGREDQWVERLGKHAVNRPHGCILVSTQIAEQSLDIDADLLITDLAPTDMLWQRIGRLHRHDRTRPPGFDEPTCHIHFPEIEPLADADALKQSLKPHSHIYDPFILLLSHRLWSERASVQLPCDIEPMVDATYPDELPPDLPPAGSDLHAELRERILRHAQKATLLAKPSARPQGSDDELIAATRLTEIRYLPILLLRSRPVRRGFLLEAIAHDGQPLKIEIGAPWQHSAARIIYLNSLRIADYKLRDLIPFDSPDWLTPFQNLARLAFYLDERCILRCVSTDQMLPFSYKSDIGIHPIELAGGLADEDDDLALPPPDEIAG